MRNNLEKSWNIVIKGIFEIFGFNFMNEPRVTNFLLGHDKSINIKYHNSSENYTFEVKLNELRGLWHRVEGRKVLSDIDITIIFETIEDNWDDREILSIGSYVSSPLYVNKYFLMIVSLFWGVNNFSRINKIKNKIWRIENKA